MEEEEFLLEERVRARKRLILLVLLLLLLGVAVTSVLLEPTPSSLPTVAEVKPPPTPSQVVTPIEAVSTPRSTPQEARDDQQTESSPTSTTSASQTPATRVSTAFPIVSGETTGAAAQADTTVEPETISPTIQSTVTGKETPPGSPAAADELEIASSTNEPTRDSDTPAIEAETPSVSTTENSDRAKAAPAATNTVQGTTPVARITPAASIGTEQDSAVSATAVASGSSNSSESNSATPERTLSLSDLPRVHELWDSASLHLPSADNGEVTKTVTPKAATSSELAEMVPPDGLPVTGVIARPKMNWAALIILVVLLGAGVTAVWHPNRK